MRPLVSSGVDSAIVVIEGSDRATSRLWVRSGPDFVGAIATGTDDPPFGTVVHNSE
ncbi:hypothetical protein [Halalkalirubrum salinum]|uniref:hypothetical protein n=1 Tax=Halalkalirubrum salinum TaxID=2563889 RepID=UPI001484D99E|nr:hypothetical protein [Halalkalirubrum salinum]